MKVRAEYNEAGEIHRWCADAGVVAGKRLRKRFGTKEEAELWTRENKAVKRTEGTKTLLLWGGLSESERGTLIRALELLRPVVSSINFEEVARVYLKHARPDGGKQTLALAINALVQRKRRANKKESYCARLERDLRAFAAEFPGKSVNDITKAMVENWIFKHTWKPITQANKLRDLHQLFAYALKEKWCAANPITNIEKPTVDWEAPHVFTPKEVRWIMEAATAHPEWDMIPFASIGLFAGLRTSELFALDWSNIDLDRKLILLSGHQTKTRARRVVDELPDNLIAWLRPHAKPSGPISPIETTIEWRLQLLIQAIQKDHPDFHWKRNGSCHTVEHYGMLLALEFIRLVHS